MGLPGLTDGLTHLKNVSLRKFQEIGEMVPVLEWIRNPGNLFSAMALKDILYQENDAQAVRKFLADMFAGEILLIADQKEAIMDGQLDEQEGAEGTGRDTTETVARSKLRIDIRRWLMEQFSPAVYGPVKSATGLKEKSKDLINSIRAKVYLPENNRGAASSFDPAQSEQD